MATYLILNLLFIGLVLLILRIRTVPHRKVWLGTFAGLVILTALFDNLIIHFDIVAYNTSKLLGVYVGFAPIEDFFYCLLAAFLIPFLWHRLGKNHAK